MQTSIRVVLCAAIVMLGVIPGVAGEKKVMHCFAWTSIREATPADWNAFFKASDMLPQKIKGISKVWYGKLLNPLGQTTVRKADPETMQRLNAGQQASAEVVRTPRDWGMCMEMRDADALKAYDTDPYHKVWTEAYSKVRVEGTTTFNIIGQ